MFFSLKTVNGHQYLYLVESKHVKGKKPVKKIIKSYGRFDKLPEEIRKRYLDEKAKKALEQELIELERKNTFSAVGTGTASTEQANQATNFNRVTALCYGPLALKKIWEQDLGLKYKIDYIQKTDTNIESWSLNDLLFYLCSLKVIDPQSYLSACETKSRFLYCPWNNVVQDNFYRALDIVYTHREALIRHAVNTHMQQTRSEVKVAFFDCTNTWFETPYDDITWQIIHFTKKIRAKLKDAGLSSEAIDQYLDGEEFAQLLQEHLDENQDNVIRMRGKSKEARFAQPIVSVALAIDQTGFPIDCKVFAGNLSETKTLVPMLESLKQKYHVKSIYFVADRGLNSTQGLEEIVKAELGFVVAQKVSRQKKAQRSEMLDSLGWKNCSIDEDGQFHTADCELNMNAFRYKVCDCTKTALVENDEPEKSAKRFRKAEVQCRIIYTFSPQRQAKDLADLQLQIARASKAVNEGSLMGNCCSSGWRGLIQTKKEAAENKADKEMYRAVGLKQDVIDDRKATAGYAAIVLRDPKEKTQSMSAEQALNTYHRLVAIEDCFKVMKSTFSIRPVHVRLHERIVAHCYLCVFSLMLMKMLQDKLNAKGIAFSSERISQALAQALVTPIPSKDADRIQFLNTALNERFHSPSLTGKGKVEQDVNAVEDHDAVWVAFEHKRGLLANDTDLIFDAVGLTPLPLLSSMGEIKRRMKIHSVRNEVMLADEQKKLLAAVASRI